MIIYGTRAVQIAKEFVPDKCPNCGSVSSIDMHVFQKYAHVFWIPFFPLERNGVSQCDKCKQILKEDQMPDALRGSYYRLKKQTKTPVWIFSGLALVAIIITSVIIYSNYRYDKNVDLVQAPQKGDIYEMKMHNGFYTVFKVSEVAKDSVFLFIGNYESNKTSGLMEILMKGNEAFSSDLYGYSRKELKAMLARGDIYDILR